MGESEPTDLDRDVEESMRMFERSQVGPAATITPIKPARVLLVLDGSSQDDASVQAACYLREQFNVETLILDARSSDRERSDGERGDGDGERGDGERGDDLASPRVAEVSGSRPIQPGEDDPYDTILAALKTHDVDLLIVPCPFGRSFQNVGTDSAGTVIDVLLSRCPKPMLVIRRDDQLLPECVSTVSMVVGSECDVTGRAAAWAFGLAGPSATVTLNLVVEKEQYENFRSIIEALQPEATLDPQQFSDALTKTHQSIHGAMAKTAGELGLTYHLRPQAGEVAPPSPLSQSSRMLIVMPLEVDDRFGQGFVQDRIRRSPHPVLVVPGHVSQ